MKLLFLYIENFRVYKDCSINFDSNERFVYADRTLSFDEGAQADVPDDFFYLSQSRATRGPFAVSSRVDCVSAVIGENGAGKTSLAEMLNHAFSRGRTEERFIYVCKVADKYICRDNLDEKINVAPILEKVGQSHLDYLHFDNEVVPPDLGMIYYSPYYSPRDDWFIGSSDGFIDISTVGRMAGKVQKEYDLAELNTIDRFIMKLGSRRKSIKRDAPIPSPGKLTIRVNRSFVGSTQREISAVIKDYALIERKGVVPYHELLIPALDRQAPTKITTELEYMQVLAIFMMILGLVRTDELVLQIVAGFMASYIRNVGYSFKDVHYDGAFIKLVKAACNILSDIRTACNENRVVNVDVVAMESIAELWNGVDAKARRRIRDSAIAALCSGSSSYSIVGESAGHGDGIVSKSPTYRALCRFGNFLRDIGELSLGHQSQGGELTISLLTVKDRNLYLGIKYAYEALQRDLFLKDAGNFLEFSAVGMSSGERAYLSMFGRMDEYIASKPLHGRNTIKNWILFLDEAETALHPAWQRQLVENVIWYVETFTRGLSVHVIFASHSPTLLSDIPNDNVVYLRKNDDGASLGNLEMQTFGANIFDLYRLAFNQSNGPMGAFAKRKIDKALKEVAELVAEKGLRHDPNSIGDDDRRRTDEDAEATLKLIGDPLIKRYLKSLREGGLL